MTKRIIEAALLPELWPIVDEYLNGDRAYWSYYSGHVVDRLRCDLWPQLPRGDVWNRVLAGGVQGARNSPHTVHSVVWQLAHQGHNPYTRVPSKAYRHFLETIPPEGPRLIPF
jgi:hypothetical protein